MLIRNEAKEELSFHVYPNPTKSLVYIDGLDANKFSYTLYNMLGQKVLFAEHTQVIDLSTFKKGIYFINIHDKKGTLVETRKVINN